MNEIAFVTTCKGRLHHIKETLPLIAALSPAEIVVVDYACPDHVGDWVEANIPGVKAVRVNDDSGFCLPRARNLGAMNTTSPWICFIDGDIKVQSNWLDWMKQHLDDTCYYRAALINGVRDNETYGTVICPRAAFEAIGGYDEVFRGWGGEDDDLYTRLRLFAQLSENSYPHDFVSALSHDDAERTLFFEVKNKQRQGLINICYHETCKHLFAMGISKIAMATRKSIMSAIQCQISEYKEHSPRVFSVQLGTHEFESNDGKTCKLILTVQRKRRFVFVGSRKLKVKSKIVP